MVCGLETEFPLLRYATKSWVSHARQGEMKGVCQDDLLQDFGWPSEGLVQLWVRVYRAIESYSSHCPSEGTSLLHVVSRYELAQLLSIILQKADQLGVGIDCRDEYGRTPLWWAAEGGHEAIVKLLFNTGKVDVDTRDKDGRTLLWRAAEKEDKTIAKLLLDTGKVDVDTRDKDGRTLLSWAAKRGDVAVIKLLLGTGKVDVDARDNWRDRTPLSWAAQGGHKAVVKLLLDTGKVHVDARDNYFGRTSLWWAGLGGDAAVVDLLRHYPRSRG